MPTRVVSTWPVKSGTTGRRDGSRKRPANGPPPWAANCCHSGRCSLISRVAVVEGRLVDTVHADRHNDKAASGQRGAQTVVAVVTRERVRAGRTGPGGGILGSQAHHEPCVAMTIRGNLPVRRRG